jgi:hypothetical protein
MGRDLAFAIALFAGLAILFAMHDPWAAVLTGIVGYNSLRWLGPRWGVDK